MHFATLSAAAKHEAAVIGAKHCHLFRGHSNPTEAWRAWSEDVETWRLTNGPDPEFRRLGRGATPGFQLVKRGRKLAHEHGRAPELKLFRQVLCEPRLDERTRQCTWARLEGRCELRNAALQDLAACPPVQSPMLVACRDALHKQIKDGLAREQETALRVWRHRMLHHDDHRRALFRWMNTDEQGDRLSSLKLAEGSVLFDEASIDAALQTAWNPVRRRRPDWPEPDFAAFLRKHADVLPVGRFGYQPLTMMDLELGLAALNGRAAPGLDGRRPNEIGQLPVDLLQLPLLILQHAENTGQWAVA